MDSNVPGNKTEVEGAPKPLSQRQEAQMAEFKKKVQMEIRENVERQHRETVKRNMTKAQKGVQETVPKIRKVPKVKKPRNSFKPVLSRDSSVITTRDLIKMIPQNEGGFTIVYDAENTTVGFQKKNTTPIEVETVAKARDRSFGHTFILANAEKDLWDEQLQEQ